MGYDQTTKTLRIKTLKRNEKEILNIVDKLNIKLIDKFSIDKIYDENKLTILLDEEGLTKHGGFVNKNNYNQYKFIKDIVTVDKDNTIVYQERYSYLDGGVIMYFYKDNEFIKINEKDYKFKQCKDKENIIKMIKKDFYYFELLSKEEQLDFDYQMASLEVDYGSVAMEYGTEGYDELYSDEFLDQVETVKAIFKFGNRFNLLKNRIKEVYKNDDKLMRECLKLRLGYIRCLPFKFRNDKELVLSLIEINEKMTENYTYRDRIESRMSLEDISDELRNDKEVVSNFIKYASYEFIFASDKLKQDYDICKLYINSSPNGISLKEIKNDDILNDKELILQEFRRMPIYDEYRLISDNLKNDKDILIEWILSNYKIGKFLFLNENAQIKQYQEKLEKMDMKELTLYALKKYKLFKITYVGSNLLNDKDFIREYTKLNDRKYDYFEIGDKLREDKEFVIELLEKNYHFKLGDKLLKDKEFIKNNFNRISNNILNELDDDIKNDYDIAKLFVEKQGNYILDLKEELKNNHELRQIALNNWRIPYINDKRYISKPWFSQSIRTKQELESLKEFIDINKDDLSGVIKLNPFLLEEIPGLSKKYKYNREFFLKLFNDGDFRTFQYIHNLFKDDKEICLKAVKNDPDNYQYLSDKLKDDYDIVKEMLIRQPESIFSLPDKYRDNEELILLSYNEIKKQQERSLKSYPLEKLSERLQQDKEFIATLLEVDNNMSIEDMYISNYEKTEKIRLYELPNFLKDNIKVIRYLYFRCGIINDIDDYPECSTVKELLEKLKKESIINKFTIQYYNLPISANE